jgi:shikimate dehydrogenase
MLVAQAIRASEFFLDTQYPTEITERIYHKILKEKENIVLTGMPASGKSSVGNRLAKMLNRKFYDKKHHAYTVKERLLEERRAIKRKDGEVARFEIISKLQMKLEVGHSPDFIEALFMVMHLFTKRKGFSRKGFDKW